MEKGLMDLEDYTQRKKRLDRLRRETDEARGARKQLLEQLKKEFDCVTLEQGQCWLDNEEQELEKLKEQREEEWSLFLSEFGDHFQ